MDFRGQMLPPRCATYTSTIFAYASGATSTVTEIYRFDSYYSRQLETFYWQRSIHFILYLVEIREVMKV